MYFRAVEPIQIIKTGTFLAQFFKSDTEALRGTLKRNTSHTDHLYSRRNVREHIQLVLETKEYRTDADLRSNNSRMDRETVQTKTETTCEMVAERIMADLSDSANFF